MASLMFCNRLSSAQMLQLSVPRKFFIGGVRISRGGSETVYLSPWSQPLSLRTPLVTSRSFSFFNSYVDAVVFNFSDVANLSRGQSRLIGWVIVLQYHQVYMILGTSHVPISMNILSYATCFLDLTIYTVNTILHCLIRPLSFNRELDYNTLIEFDGTSFVRQFTIWDSIDTIDFD